MLGARTLCGAGLIAVSLTLTFPAWIVKEAPILLPFSSLSRHQLLTHWEHIGRTVTKDFWCPRAVPVLITPETKRRLSEAHHHDTDASQPAAGLIGIAGAMSFLLRRLGRQTRSLLNKFQVHAMKTALVRGR
ncbi:MAG: hypothetical protein ACK4RK_15260 [Gemmataceae bacterium]